MYNETRGLVNYAVMRLIMEDLEIQNWAKAYIEVQQAHGLNTDHPKWWAVEKFMDIGGGDTTPEDSLKAILAVLRLEPAEKIIGVLAAGPLEDLIENAGPEVIDKVEILARQNPSFRHLLGGVWESGKPEVWKRILACRGEVW
ncbi:MAG: DUF6869 domain-containing protein [Candidatus Thiodiazotropha sp.]